MSCKAVFLQNYQSKAIGRFPYIQVHCFTKSITICQTLTPNSVAKFTKPGVGGTCNYFLTVWAAAEVWNPYPFLRISCPQKMADLTVLSNFFSNLILQFFRNFCEMVSSSRIFLTKMGLLSKDFWWKTNSLSCMP